MAKQLVAELERISPQREALAKAIANYKQAQADYAVAETAANDAENARWRVLSEIEDAADKLRQAKRMQDPDRIFVCEEGVRQAQPTEFPARAAVVAAKEKSELAAARLREAEYQIRPAVDEVLRSEMAPAVEEILAEFQAAQARIIACGTSIQNIYEQHLAPREGALKTAYHELFTNPAGWPGFYDRYKWDPFRHVAALLSQDAGAPVPTGPL